MPSETPLKKSQGSSLLYKLAVQEKWVDVQERVLDVPEEAQYTHPIDNTTPLHAAIQAHNSGSTSTSVREERLAAIGALIAAYPNAACVRTRDTGDSPLALACITADDNHQVLQEDETIIRMILDHKPESIKLLTADGYSPVDLHIMSYSEIMRLRSLFDPGVGAGNGRYATTSILKLLLKHFEYKDDGKTRIISRQLELLFDCNSLEILENIALEEAEASSSKLQARRLARSRHAFEGSSVSGGSVYSAASTHLKSFWVWEWATLLIMSYIEKTKTEQTYNTVGSSSSIMHAAAQVPDCPLPFLIMAMRAYPEDVRTPDPKTGNYPLHYVASWEDSSSRSDETEEYHSSLACRKSMALSALISEYPDATHYKNKKGQTPMTLALVTGTPWECGMKKLTAQTSSHQNMAIHANLTDNSIG